MLHLVFDRPKGVLKVFDGSGDAALTYEAAGDAWGNHGVSDDSTPPAPPYGHACWMPPGHYLLTPVQLFSEPIASEGYGQIPVVDLDDLTARRLISAGKAVSAPGDRLTIGGITLLTGQLEAHQREAIMIHCGGSNAPDPFADRQGLYRTFGCTRMQNADWRALAAHIASLETSNLVLYSAIGDPQELAA